MNDRILIAGTHSGCGKTTVTTALLSALRRRGVPLSAFKCGPDYIDPMFHRRALGLPSHNLDSFFSDREQLRAMVSGAAGTLSVIEGVMGYYDGIGTEGRCGAYDTARATETPVVLVVDARGMYTSAGAILRGFKDFRPESGIQGVIFNGVSPMTYRGLAEIARAAHVEPLGFLPSDSAAAIGSRHLGLITADEIENIETIIEKMGGAAEKNIDIDALLTLAAKAPPLPYAAPPKPAAGPVRIAVARDEAFCFLYQENLELLEALGCELRFFSPLHDGAPPEGAKGLYLPGGYPELHTAELATNKAMLNAIRDAVLGGLPTIAECGGFMYLHDELEGAPMAGVIPGKAYKTDHLRRFGYATVTAQRDNLLCKSGQSARVHEFHFYESENNGSDFSAQKASGGAPYPCCHGSETLYAGFPHLYFPACPAFAENFVKKAAAYK